MLSCRYGKQWFPRVTWSTLMVGVPYLSMVKLTGSAWNTIWHAWTNKRESRKWDMTPISQIFNLPVDINTVLGFIATATTRTVCMPSFLELHLRVYRLSIHIIHITYIYISIQCCAPNIYICIPETYVLISISYKPTELNIVTPPCTSTYNWYMHTYVYIYIYAR